MWKATLTMGFLSLGLLATIGAVPPAGKSALDALPASQVPVAIAQPLVAIEGGPLAAVRPTRELPESGLLVLVGSALFGLAAAVRKHS